MRLKNETTIDLDHADLASFLTEEFCGVYSKFQELRVECVSVKDDGRTFSLSLTQGQNPKRVMHDHQDKSSESAQGRGDTPAGPLWRASHRTLFHGFGRPGACRYRRAPNLSRQSQAGDGARSQAANSARA